MLLCLDTEIKKVEEKMQSEVLYNVNKEAQAKVRSIRKTSKGNIENTRKGNRPSQARTEDRKYAKNYYT